jgi:dolichyl-diphosphooligosaccharide--protein glycosyltransferase
VNSQVFICNLQIHLNQSNNLSIFCIFDHLYIQMVATWGGYVFVLNMIGLHAAILVALGRFSTKVYLSFSLFYVIGTALAIQVPVVGLTPLKSLEQLGVAAIFIGYQVLFICETIIRKKKLSRADAWKVRTRTILIATATVAIFLTFFLPSNYFGPLSSRVRGLFVKHTKTGNPLVDSVAEHQPAKPNAFYQYLHQLCTFAPVGFCVILGYFGDSPSFLSAYAVAAYFFSLKMVRLILLIGPISSILSGIAAGRLLVWIYDQLSGIFSETSEKEITQSNDSVDQTNNGTKKKKLKKPKVQVSDDDLILNELSSGPTKKEIMGIIAKRTIAFVLLLTLYFSASAFNSYSWSISYHLSNPSIIQKARTRSGTVVMIDDYREAYWWVRDNTPEDARVMAWWDYGYQLASIANRTTIADGNTWNHEHIALLGKIYTTDVDEAYSIARHLADYILVWAGGGGDDLAKSPHLARIANSVYRDLCPNDPVCTSFGLVVSRYCF